MEKLKTSKFYQMLHVIDCIIRYGCPMNNDGSMVENLNAKVTNKVKDTLNFDINFRIAENDIVYTISTICYHNNGQWVSKYCNETDMIENDSKV